MFLNFIKFLFNAKDDALPNKTPEVVGVITKICNIAKKITGEESFDHALKKIKYNKKHKFNFLKALKVADNKFYEDRINARSRDLSLHDKYGNNHRANLMLFFVCIGLSFSVILIICFKNLLSPELIAILTGVIGILSSCLKEAFHFEFGGKNDKKRITKALVKDEGCVKHNKLNEIE